MTMSSGWRQGPADIPTEFHHRPGHLIRHMQDVTSKAVSISSDMVMTNDAGYHTVRSSQRKTVYKVDIGDAERMPSCSCYAFQRHHLPCKHFAAVFLHKQLTWSSLPANYRDHPILTCDSDCLAESDGTATPDVSVVFNDTTGTDGAVQEGTVADLTSATQPSENTSDLVQAACRCREVLGNITNLTYLSKSAAVLNEATVLFSDIAGIVARSCPADCLKLLPDEKKEQAPPAQINVCNTTVT